jgi:hypothetical protein
VGKTIGLKLRFDNFHTVTRDQTLPAPTGEAAVIRRAAANARACRWSGASACSACASSPEPRRQPGHATPHRPRPNSSPDGP